MGGARRCVDFCPTGALRFGDKEEFGDELANAEFQLPAYDYEPHVYYINMPHLFLGGAVHDSETGEIIAGANVTLTRNDGVTFNGQTDDLGYFKIGRLAEGIYDLHIEMEGYSPFDKNFQFFKSTFLGDISLERG